MSITPIAPLTVEPTTPLDPDWFDDDIEYDDTPETIAKAIEAHSRLWLSRYTNTTAEMIVISQLVSDVHAICAAIARSHHK